MTNYLDAGTISSTTKVTSVDRGPFNDSSTPKSVTKVSVNYEDFVVPAGYWGPFDTDDGII